MKIGELRKVQDLATGKTFAMEREAKAFLLDGAGRMWLVVDSGEWGGGVTRVDLVKGTVETIKSPHVSGRGPEGLLGWRLRVYRVEGWAFGGSSHTGFIEGFVRRIDGAEPRPLFAFEPPDDFEKRPDSRLLITHVVEEDGGLLVLSHSDVFRVDKGLTSWTKVATLGIRYRWGRLDAVGAYPSVRVVHATGGAGDPYVLAKGGDGYVLLEGAQATVHGLPGQLGASRSERLLNCAEGTLVSHDDDRLPT